MALKSDRERVRDLAGWNFVQWAYAAAYADSRNALPVEITLDSLMKVQRVWREQIHEQPPNTMTFGATTAHENRPYRWAWTCGAIAAAADELFKGSTRPK